MILKKKDNNFKNKKFNNYFFEYKTHSRNGGLSINF